MLCAASVSCSGGNGLNPVHGKVLHKGSGAQGVVVTFHPKGADKNAVTVHRPVGMTGPDGSFTLATGAKEGAEPGKYVVTFIWPEEVKSKAKGISTEAADSRDRLNLAYTDPGKSEFQVEVKSGRNDLPPFHLK